MTRCHHCEEEVEAGRDYCPHCGGPLSVAAEVEATQSSPDATPPATAPMSSYGRPVEEPDKSRRTVFIAAAVIGLLLVGALAWWASRPTAQPGEDRLEGAVRPGSPEFPGPDKLMVEFVPDEHAQIGPTALGPWAVSMRPVVRNYTGRTVSGLEFRAAGLDRARQVIRERVYVTRQEIEPNKILIPPITVQFPQDNKPADLQLELTGVRFK